MTQKSGVQSIDRVFDMIELLSLHPQGLRLMEIEEQTGLHKSTAHRQLAALIARGYVTQNQDDRRYRLTLKLFEVSSRLTSSLDVLEVARRPLDALRDRSQEAVHLVVREKSDIVYIHKSEVTESGIQMVSHVGMRRPMYCTAVGKSILATLSPEEIQEVWHQSQIKAYTQHTLTTLDQLFAELEEVRLTGYAMDNEENELGVRCMATAVPDYSGKSHAAFSISAPLVRMSDHRVAELVAPLLETRRQIGRQMGYPVP